MSAKDIFDRAITLNPGDTLLIPCHDTRQQESMRVSLAYQRRVFLGSAKVGFDIIASKVTKEGKPFISIAKMPRITQGFIISADGGVKTTSLEADPITNLAHDAVDMARIKKSMKEDGYSDADIDAYLSGQQVSKNDTSDEPVCLAPDKEEP